MAGDGTTSVVVICGALLKKCQELLEKGVHPTIISDAFDKAAQKACQVRSACRFGVGRVARGVHDSTVTRRSLRSSCACVQILESVAIPINLEDRDALIRAATTCVP